MRDASLSSRRSEAMLSLGLLFFAFFAFLITRDLFYDASWPYGWEGRIEYQWWTEFGSLLTITLFAIPILLWHAFDAFSVDQPKTAFDRALGSYPLVLSLLILGLLGNAILESGLTEWIDCYEAHLENTDGDNFGSFCTPTPGYLAEYLVLPFLLTLILIVMVKAGVLIFRKLA